MLSTVLCPKPQTQNPKPKTQNPNPKPNRPGASHGKQTSTCWTWTTWVTTRPGAVRQLGTIRRRGMSRRGVLAQITTERFPPRRVVLFKTSFFSSGVFLTPRVLLGRAEGRNAPSAPAGCLLTRAIASPLPSAEGTTQGRLPESQGRNLALSVVYVPYSHDSGSRMPRHVKTHSLGASPPPVHTVEYDPFIKSQLSWRN